VAHQLDTDVCRVRYRFNSVVHSLVLPLLFAATRLVFELSFVGGWAGAVSIDSLKKRLIENKRLYTAGGGGSGGGGSGGGSGGASSPTTPTLSDHFADRWGGEKRRVRKAARYASSHISFSFGWDEPVLANCCLFSNVADMSLAW
jgi:hypothetical protein